MPEPTPFHPRTSALCTSLFWKEWAGHYAVRSYNTCHEREYFALRHGAGLIDVSPLYKYEVRGPDAGRMLSGIMVRDVGRMAVGRVSYLCWCDDDGKVLDDGTVARLDKNHFRVTAAEAALAHLLRRADRYDVRVEDSTRSLGALALQGPTSRAILEQVADAPVSKLRYFRIVRGRIAGCPVWISRTGYTGDLGFEVWIERDDALTVWDALMESGRGHRLLPMGLDAMDVARVEAGFIMNGVDYFSAHQCPIESRKSTPYELGLGWTVKLDRGPFVGQTALRAERRRGSHWALVGLEYDWDQYEALFAEVGLPPQVPGGAWRDAVPVCDSSGKRIGQATSGAWSPMLKRNLALASVHAEYREPGTRLLVEVTVEYSRQQIEARVRPTPFFDPERKRA